MDYDIIFVPFNYLTLEKCFQMARISPILDTSLPINTLPDCGYQVRKLVCIKKKKMRRKETNICYYSVFSQEQFSYRTIREQTYFCIKIFLSNEGSKNDEDLKELPLHLLQL